MRDGEILALQLLADENTQRKHRQRFVLISTPYVIRSLLKTCFFNLKAPVGDGAISLLYLNSAVSNL